jgi:hypothetical protein
MQQWFVGMPTCPAELGKQLDKLERHFHAASLTVCDRHHSSHTNRTKNQQQNKEAEANMHVREEVKYIQQVNKKTCMLPLWMLCHAL